MWVMTRWTYMPIYGLNGKILNNNGIMILKQVVPQMPNIVAYISKTVRVRASTLLNSFQRFRPIIIEKGWWGPVIGVLVNFLFLFSHLI